MVESISSFLFACKISPDECRITGKTDFDENAFWQVRWARLGRLARELFGLVCTRGFPQERARSIARVDAHLGSQWFAWAVGANPAGSWPRC